LKFLRYSKETVKKSFAISLQNLTILHRF